MAVTPSELAERANTTTRYVQQLCRQGRIKATKPGGRDWLIPDEEAERWLRERRKRLKKP